MFRSKTFGFTLAEVLITLGIIGVVAAMTIPTLMTNIGSAKYRTQLKKTLSTLNQAGRMAKAQYDFDFGSVNVCGNSGAENENPAQTQTMCALLNGTLTGHSYMGTIDSLGGPTGEGYGVRNIGKGTIHAGLSSGYLIYALPDGAFVVFSNIGATAPGGFSMLQAKNCTIPQGQTFNNSLAGRIQCIGFIDVNGLSLPNEEVLCSDGTNTAIDVENTCKVESKDVKDIYPITFYDGTVVPITNAGRYVFTTAK